MHVQVRQLEHQIGLVQQLNSQGLRKEVSEAAAAAAAACTARRAKAQDSQNPDMNCANPEKEGPGAKQDSKNAAAQPEETVPRDARKAAALAQLAHMVS